MAVCEATTQAFRRLQRAVIEASTAAETLSLAGGDVRPAWVDFHCNTILTLEHAAEELEVALTKETAQ